MSFVSAGHIILTPTQPVRRGRPQRGSNPGHPQLDSRALTTDLPPPILKAGSQLELFFSRHSGRHSVKQITSKQKCCSAK